METALPAERQASDGPGDPGEGGDPAATVERVDLLLGAVEQALVRLDDGTYGQCQRCGGSIEDERLTDDPTVGECASCALGVDVLSVAPAAIE